MGGRVLIFLLAYLFCVYIWTDEASSLLENQESKREESHKEIVGDIEGIKSNIDQVWQSVGENILLLTL